ncbi:Reverse transcriptase (RNA-dependent DNA polymerase) [candidate division SR1 bacterium Aalborg_AAW-1]|nr:Reverse transcriptase (RNA-dependent DNA polymerase) [candidate division SR1 bacterium Aalborg_AAW-1]
MMSQAEHHYNETKRGAKKLNKDVIAKWLLQFGYYPEQNVLPPQFKVKEFKVKNPYYTKGMLKNSNNLSNHINLSYPKTQFNDRLFSLQDPKYYHDIVHIISNNWNKITKLLFPNGQKIFSYSFPIPLYHTTNLRSGRMIYERIQMAEGDLVVDSHRYKYIVKADVTNFYHSIYTHTISWAITDRIIAYIKKNDYDDNIFGIGNKLDRLFQKSNDLRTVGIPIGSAVSDLIAEIILSRIDQKVSRYLKINKIDFIGTRFKDDYRFLCNSKEDATIIIKGLSKELSKFNLILNDKKTEILTSPTGLYRLHTKEYEPLSLKNETTISFKKFELVLLKTIEIHEKYPGTSLIEKFLSELYNKEYKIKIDYNSFSTHKQHTKIYKSISLIFSLYNYSKKSLGSCIGLILLIYDQYKIICPDLRFFIESIIKNGLIISVKQKLVFDSSWFIFTYNRLGITIPYDIKKEILTNNYLDSSLIESLIKNKQLFFENSGLKGFIKKKDIKDMNLAKELNIFDKNEDIL